MLKPFVIAIANQKGGVAKTTSVVSLGGALVNHEMEVLLIDLDAQANLTLALGKDPARVRGAISEVFFNAASLASVSRETGVPGLDLVPSNANMDTAERFLPLRKNYETILRTAILGSSKERSSPLTPKSGTTEENDIPTAEFSGGGNNGKESASHPAVLPPAKLPPATLPPTNEYSRPENIADDSPAIPGPSGPGPGRLASYVGTSYDFILIDCPPIIGAVTLNAIAAADMLLIPTQPEYFSAHALRTMMLTIKQIRSQFNPNLVYRILITMLDRRNRIHRQVSEQIRQTFGVGVLNTVIEVDTKLRESAVEGLPVTHHRTASGAHPPRSAVQYEALAQELIEYVKSN